MRRGCSYKVGNHRGDAIVVSSRRGKDYFGQTVNIAARIGAIAGSGEIVLSDAVCQGGSVPALLAGHPVHEEQVSLKGVSREVLVYRFQPAQQIHACVADVATRQWRARRASGACEQHG